VQHQAFVMVSHLSSARTANVCPRYILTGSVELAAMLSFNPGQYQPLRLLSTPHQKLGNQHFDLFASRTMCNYEVVECSLCKRESATFVDEYCAHFLAAYRRSQTANNLQSHEAPVPCPVRESYNGNLRRRLTRCDACVQRIRETARQLASRRWRSRQ